MGEQVSVKCLAIETAGFIVTTTDQGRLHSLQIDGQSRSPGPPSLREAIATTYGAAVWLAQLPGFPSARPTEGEIDNRPAEGTEGTESGDDSDEVIDLTSPMRVVQTWMKASLMTGKASTTCRRKDGPA